jgi:hypothetical protein
MARKFIRAIRSPKLPNLPCQAVHVIVAGYCDFPNLYGSIRLQGTSVAPRNWASPGLAGAFFI